MENDLQQWQKDQEIQKQFENIVGARALLENAVNSDYTEGLNGDWSKLTLENLKKIAECTQLLQDKIKSKNSSLIK